jgi:hypothetical protein
VSITCFLPPRPLLKTSHAVRNPPAVFVEPAVYRVLDTALLMSLTFLYRPKLKTRFTSVLKVIKPNRCSLDVPPISSTNARTKSKTYWKLSLPMLDEESNTKITSFLSIQTEKKVRNLLKKIIFFHNFWYLSLRL